MSTVDDMSKAMRRERVAGIASFAKKVSAYKHICSGCGGEDISVFDKEGVEHWVAFDANDRRIPDRVCGKFKVVEKLSPA